MVPAWVKPVVVGAAGRHVSPKSGVTLHALTLVTLMAILARAAVPELLVSVTDAAQ